ncbi:hypothetical protein [Paraburkholderia sp. J94]|uniref:hypothetical protein n=1 Tax=Paraburkholderia sp. J94 TaxID=2805441 RepID=UPI002AB13398|nr:hypothetical protein [Paraburkholderia sp. J94]
MSISKSKSHNAWSLLVLLLGALTFVTTCLGVIRQYSPVPFGDQWDGTLGFYMEALEHPYTAFFGLHNEHRLFFSRLIFFADVRYFGGRNVLDLAANIVLAGLLALLIYRIAMRHAGQSRQARMIAAGAALAFCFSWMQVENFSWGFQSQWFAVYLFGLCAFHALDLSELARKRAATTVSSAWFATSIGAAVMAALSMASGVLVAPVLLVQAVYLRTTRMRGLLLVLATFAIWLAYFTNWQTQAPNGGLHNSLVHHPLGVLAYGLLYIGSPVTWSGFGAKSGFLWGAVVLLGVAYSTWLALRRRAVSASALLAMPVFVCGNALVTAAGRVGLGLETATSSRYTTAPLIMTASLIAFLWLNETRPARRKMIAGVFAIALTIVVVAQRTVFHSAHGALYAKQVAGLALRAHVYDAVYTGVLFPDAGALKSLATPAEAMGLSIFAPDQTDFSAPPSTISATAHCAGTIDSVTDTATPDRLAATGWIYDTQAKHYVTSIVIADMNGKVLGTGIAGARRNDLKPLTGSDNREGGWVGFFKRPDGGTIQAFGEIEPGKYCVVAEKKQLPASAPNPSETSHQP